MPVLTIILKASFHSGKLSVDWNGQENYSLSCELWGGTNDFHTQKKLISCPFQSTDSSPERKLALTLILIIVPTTLHLTSRNSHFNHSNDTITKEINRTLMHPVTTNEMGLLSSEQPIRRSRRIQERKQRRESSNSLITRWGTCALASVGFGSYFSSIVDRGLQSIATK